MNIALNHRNRSNQLQARREELRRIIEWCEDEQCADVRQKRKCQSEAHDYGYCQAMGYVTAICKDRISELKGEGDE